MPDWENIKPKNVKPHSISFTPDLIEWLRAEKELPEWISISEIVRTAVRRLREDKLSGRFSNIMHVKFVPTIKGDRSRRTERRETVEEINQINGVDQDVSEFKVSRL